MSGVLAMRDNLGYHFTVRPYYKVFNRERWSRRLAVPAVCRMRLSVNISRRLVRFIYDQLGLFYQ